MKLMKNKILSILLSILLSISLNFNVYGADPFNFDITEVEILDNGNIIKGLKKGTVETNDGITITANNFFYNKLTNILTADGNVEIIDPSQDLKIFSDNAIYQKNNEIIITNKNSKAIYGVGKFIYADTFKLFRKDNILNAKDDVKIEDTIDNHLITGNDFTYFINSEKIISKGKTKAYIDSKYKITSKNVTYLVNKDILSSDNTTRIEDENSQVYFIERFNYQINQEILKGEEFLIITNYNLPKSDKMFFESAILNLKNKKFIAKDTEIEIHNDIFGNPENNPRLKGVSSIGDENTTIINKGLFTSCKKNDDCPPWSIKADKIKHDKTKRQLIYDNAILKVYDFPVVYMPKFFHPDPTVERQSGFIKQSINSSSIIGSSISVPYFKVISENQDVTLTPTLFDSDTQMISAEYRQANKNSKFLLDTSFVNGYKSSTTKQKNSLSHLFLKFNQDLNLDDYDTSKLNFTFEKMSGPNTYLKVFDQYITNSEVRPSSLTTLNKSAVLTLDHETFNLSGGIQSYENLGVNKNNDRYSYNLPYYNFSKSLEQDFINGNFSFNSSGNNYLKNTNQLETNIINNLSYNSLDFISSLGIKNNFGINFKNLNSIGKNSTKYKSSPQSELLSIYNFDVSFPLKKDNEKSKNFLTPKLSFRFNPSDMKNYSSSGNIVDANNAFLINRLGLSDSFESGRSLTLGIDYKKEINDETGKDLDNDLDDINNYFEIKLATIFRDKEEKFIPNKSSLNRTNSNLFGSIKSKFSDNFSLEYDFSLDNDYNTLEYNSINPKISINNLVTTFNFTETNGERGDTNILETSIDYNLSGKNSLQFNTRRNRKINLTEYYDLVYEYKNDCLTAGIKYKKTYYSDGDLKPKEDLLFTITLFPLTTYEYDAADDLDRLQGN
jgi:LPS-assembly protein